MRRGYKHGRSAPSRYYQRVLDVAKIEFGRVELNETVTDLSAIFEASLRAVKIEARTARIKRLKTSPPKAIFIDADETRLKQVVIDILSNSVKFTPRLPLAKQLIEMHGGSIAMSSTPSVGTAVFIRLPQSRVSNETFSLMSACA
jgi:signal transduction histidine kinase